MNHKKMYRLYHEEKLMVRRRGGRKRALGTRAPMLLPERLNQRWSLDFIADTLSDGRRFRILCVVDDFSRECLACVVDTSLSGVRVVRELERLTGERPAATSSATRPVSSPPLASSTTSAGAIFFRRSINAAMPRESCSSLKISSPGNTATSSLALLTSIPTITSPSIPTPAFSGRTRPCMMRARSAAPATVRALTWLSGRGDPRSPPASCDQGSFGLPRPGSDPS